MALLLLFLTEVSCERNLAMRAGKDQRNNFYWNWHQRMFLPPLRIFLASFEIVNASYSVWSDAPILYLFFEHHLKHTLWRVLGSMRCMDGL
jgi:hypothetical protein